uniref:7TM GPCR serpentine receptor class x (Srx) domain-containing protein n=1 Tax=Panagrolaimus davidi TaxID=227884 RepID=A0A914QH49_9BILA
MNRCFAIIFPIKYHVNFTIDIAKRLILGVMTLALLSAGISFLYPCNPYFNTTEHIWGSRDEQCWERIGKYADRSVSAIIAGGSLVFDVITWIYLLSINKRFKQHSATNSVNEKRFFFQVSSL